MDFFDVKNFLRFRERYYLGLKSEMCYLMVFKSPFQIFLDMIISKIKVKILTKFYYFFTYKNNFTTRDFEFFLKFFDVP